MTEYAPGPQNVFISAFDKKAAADLLQEYSRDPKTYPFAAYGQIKHVDQRAGHYVKISVEDAIRVINEQDFDWPDGNDRPVGQPRKHEFVEYVCKRAADGFRLGDLTIQQAVFNVLASNARGTQTKMALLREVKAASVLETTGNWSGMTDTAANEGGGKWDVSGAADQFIQKTVNSVQKKILKATGGVVHPGDLMVMFNPDTAHIIAESAEIKQYIINNESAMKAWQGTELFQTWGIPPFLWGTRVLVNTAVKDTAQEGETSAKSYAIGDNAVFLHREGPVFNSANADVPTLSTITMFSHEEMTVETEHEKWHRRTLGSVVDDYVMKITSPISGYLVTDVSAN